jgi:membrane protein required for colicin V production
MSLSSFNYIDYLILLVVLVSAGTAAWRGFLYETLSILAWIAAAFAALYFGPWVAPRAREWIPLPWAGSLAAYAGVFLVVFVPLSFLSHRLSQGVKRSAIGGLDRLFGVAFGVVRGLAVMGLVYIAFIYFVPVGRQPHAVAEAQLLPVVQKSGEVLLSLLPGRDHAGVAAKSEPRDSLGELIRQNEEANREAKTYGAKDRRALDNLVKSGKP